MSQSIKSVALINDLCGLGRCSLSVAVPIISASGIQAVSVPTSILSCHTGFDSFSFMDFTPYLSDFISSLEKQKQKVDAVYTGFVGSANGLDIIIDFVKQSDSFILVDPVMGDNGKSYSTYNAEMCSKMKELVSLADITTPNLTEACILADTNYKDSFTDNELNELAQRICSSGVKVCIITGIVSGSLISTYVHIAGGDSFYIQNNKTTVMYDGTGDIFASVLCGQIMRGKELKEAVEFACRFVSKATAYTMKLKAPPINGIAFEPFLAELNK